MLNIESIEFDDEITQPGSLRPQELEAVYAISRAVSTAVNMDDALDEIIRLTRPVFIFDNIVLYLRREMDILEPAYARASGRGRSQGSDLTWGESPAMEALQHGQAGQRLDAGHVEPALAGRVLVVQRLRAAVDLARGSHGSPSVFVGLRAA